MFKKTSQATQNVPAPAKSRETAGPDSFLQNRVKEHKRSMLSPSIMLNGDISGEEDLMLDGRMEGSISLPNNEVLIGPSGQIKADVTALKVSVEGRLTGDIKSAERVVIKHSGRVEGNIVAPRVVLEDGCQFKGSVEMNIDAESSGAKRAGTEAKGPETQSRGTNDDTAGSKTAASSSKVDNYQGQGRSRASGGA